MEEAEEDGFVTTGAELPEWETVALDAETVCGRTECAILPIAPGLENSVPV